MDQMCNVEIIVWQGAFLGPFHVDMEEKEVLDLLELATNENRTFMVLWNRFIRVDQISYINVFPDNTQKAPEILDKDWNTIN